jgi:hypothetical protein
MQNIKQLETHRHWKHKVSGGVYRLFGYGRWKGGMHTAKDLDQVVVFRGVGMEGLADLDVVPQGTLLPEVHTADAALLQTSRELKADDELVCYVAGDRMFAQLATDFFDGRYVKVDSEGRELPAEPKKA